MLDSTQSENSHGAGKKIIISVIVIAVVVGISFLIYKKVQAPSLQDKIQAIDTVQTSVGNGVGKTNPFNVDVNPYQGYTNPFE